MKKLDRIKLNVAALVLAHIIIAFLTKMATVHRAYLIISFLFDIVYCFLLTQMLYRRRAVFSKQLFDGGSPWYKQLGIVKIILLIIADTGISFAVLFISNFVIAFTPTEHETIQTIAVVLSYVIIWVSYIVFYLILTGKNAFTNKRLSLLIAGVTFVLTIAFSFVELGIYSKVMGNTNNFTQYVELLDYSNTSAAMKNVLKCLVACAIVTLYELGTVEYDISLEENLDLSSDDNEDDKDIDGEEISPADYADDEGDIIKDSLSEDN